MGDKATPGSLANQNDVGLRMTSYRKMQRFDPPEPVDGAVPLKFSDSHSKVLV